MSEYDKYLIKILDYDIFDPKELTPHVPASVNEIVEQTLEAAEKYEIL